MADLVNKIDRYIYGFCIWIDCGCSAVDGGGRVGVFDAQCGDDCWYVGTLFFLALFSLSFFLSLSFSFVV